MHHARFIYWAITIGLLAGCLVGMQPSANGMLGRYVAHPLQAAVISFASGLTLLIFLAICFGHAPLGLTASWTSIPWWAWTGGAIGAFLVTTSLYFVPRTGSLVWFGAVITGQIVAAVVLDHWGLMGNPRIAASPMRTLGTVMLILGVLMITRAKMIEQSAISKSSSFSSPGVNAAYSIGQERGSASDPQSDPNDD